MVKTANWLGGGSACILTGVLFPAGLARAVFEDCAGILPLAPRRGQVRGIKLIRRGLMGECELRQAVTQQAGHREIDRRHDAGL